MGNFTCTTTNKLSLFEFVRLPELLLLTATQINNCSMLLKRSRFGVWVVQRSEQLNSFVYFCPCPSPYWCLHSLHFLFVIPIVYLTVKFCNLATVWHRPQKMPVWAREEWNGCCLRWPPLMLPLLQQSQTDTIFIFDIFSAAAAHTGKIYFLDNKFGKRKTSRCPDRAFGRH